MKVKCVLNYGRIRIRIIYGQILIRFFLKDSIRIKPDLGQPQPDPQPWVKPSLSFT